MLFQKHFIDTVYSYSWISFGKSIPIPLNRKSQSVSMSIPQLVISHLLFQHRMIEPLEKHLKIL